MKYYKIKVTVVFLIGLSFAHSSSAIPRRSCATKKCPPGKHCAEYAGVPTCEINIPGLDYSVCCNCTYKKKLKCKSNEYCTELQAGLEQCEPKPKSGSCATTKCAPPTRCHERKQEGYCNGKKCSFTITACIVN